MKMSNSTIAVLLLAAGAITAAFGVNRVRHHSRRLTDRKALKHEKLTWENEGGNLITPAVTPAALPRA